MRIEPYLFFNGRCDEALQFYTQALGAKVTLLMRFKDAPEQEGMPQVDPDKVMHANLQIGGSQVMASDGMCSGTQAFNGFNLSISTHSLEQAEQVFAALAEGGQVGMPLQKTFWASAFGMLTDRFGVGWMVNCEAADPGTSLP
ncbi:VOC family protein [Pseudomonas sp. 2FG]|uniref:VOC family protein n=1 Tax=Pseudomonas sp. 2FG TaxID=2502191 RepID=UPI0010F47ADF|nr:VOC family protein [Pseudomonas sp. 2FG]